MHLMHASRNVLQLQYVYMYMYMFMFRIVQGLA